MKARSFILTIFLFICFSITAQVDDFQQRIIECLQLNGTTTVYEQEYDNTLHLLYKQFKTANAPESFWEELRSDRSEKVNEVIPILAFAYRKHFSKDDIDKMLEFYNTETAQIWIESPSQLTEEQQSKVDAFLESYIGLRLAKKKKLLKKDMDEIASHWKRELFAQKMSSLIKNDYYPE
jgi:hypothetical protein